MESPVGSPGGVAAVPVASALPEHLEQLVQEVAALSR